MNNPVPGDTHLDLTDDRRNAPVIHRWFGRRGMLAARAVVALTAAPALAADNSAIRQLLDPELAASGDLIRQAVVEGRPAALLDLCSGVGIVSEAALRLGMVPTAVDLHPIAVLSSRCLIVYPCLYAEADAQVPGSAGDRSWRGLAQELQFWSSEVLAGTKADVGELWLDGTGAVECARIIRCPHCGEKSPLAAGAAGNSSTPSIGRAPYYRGYAACPRCGTQVPLRAVETEEWIPVALVGEDLRTELPLSAYVTDVLTVAKYPASLASRLHETWAVARSGPISHRDGTTARQAGILDAFRRSIRRVRAEMADAGYAPDRIVALSTYLGLAASDLIDHLCTGTVLRQGRIQPALSRGAWVPGYEFIEIGGRSIQRLWQRRISAMSAVIEGNANLPRTASVLSGDMAELPLEGERFDLVIWDPPFYDNIDYDLLTAPWTSFLRSAIGELDANLRWPHVRPSADIKLPDRFDPKAYEQSLSKAASQIVKLARPGARLGVFWVSRDAQDLQRFVGLMQPPGLELIQTIALRTGFARHDEAPETYLLVLRVLKQVGGSTGPLVNAERLLELSSTGQQSLAAGLTGVLAGSLDTEEINSLLPEGLKGSVNQRLAEFVATQPDPTDLLRELGYARLRQEAQRLGSSRDQLAGLDAAGLARLVLRQLGFTVPSAPAFSIGAALQDADRARSRLQLAVSDMDVTGSGMAAIDAIERILRFSVVTWCTHSRGDDWENLVEQSVGKTDRLSFGDWVALFTVVPKSLSQENDIYLRTQRLFKRQRVVETLQPLVRTRNQLAHPEPGQNWQDVRDSLDSRLRGVILKLSGLLEEAALPVVLQPVEEIRDRYSRFRLRLLDHGERDVELVVAGPTDLTKPRIILRASTNSREVDPELLDASVIEERMGLTAN